MHGLAWLLIRLFHVLAGVFWAGGAILLAWHVMPAVRASGAGGAAIMKQLTVVQRLPLKLVVAAITTLVSGGYLMWVESGGLNSAWLLTGPGITYSAGAIATLLAAIIGFCMNIPAAIRMGALAATVAARPGGGTPEEAQTLGRLAALIARGTQSVASLLIVAVGAMAVARYVP